ncbi:MAG: NTP transferase domain-containing protein [Thaumarchaeota archaeon]|nr:NTP transferase domain-containing protein [Candidatus Calditenuaceae archaeon]MDW8041453.1 NTP transferase domain-containing protein [Nitrososphaerota archaeon]
MSMVRLHTSALILTEFRQIGGSRRGLLKLRSRPLIQYVFESIPDEVDELVVSVADESEAEEYREIVEQYLGSFVMSSNVALPKIVHGVLSEKRTDRVLVLPCDAPLLTVEFTTFLLDLTRGFNAAVPSSPEGDRNYFFSAYRAEEFLRAYEVTFNKDSMGDVVGGMRNVIYLNYRALRSLDPKLTFILRVNGPEDLRRAELLMQRR